MLRLFYSLSIVMIFVYIILNNHILVEGGGFVTTQLNLMDTINNNYSSSVNMKKYKKRRLQVNPILLKKNYGCILIVNFNKLNSKEIFKFKYSFHKSKSNL